MTETVQNPYKTQPRYLSQVEFARRKGWDKSRVTRMKQAGLIVMQGKMVDVAASEAQIGAQSDPSKDLVREYHAEKRAEKAENAAHGVVKEGKAASKAETDIVGLSYQKARTMNEIEKAKTAKRENEIAEGKLLVKDAVVAVAYEAALVIKTRLETLPDTLSPQFAAETDEARIRGVFIDAIETLLGELKRQVEKMARQGD